MIHEIPATTVRQEFNDLLNQVQYHHDSIVITEDGKAVAAIVDIELFNTLRQMRQTFEQTLQILNTMYAGVPAEQAESEIAEAVDFACEHRRRRQQLLPATTTGMIPCRLSPATGSLR